MRRKKLIALALLLFTFGTVTMAQNRLERLRSWAGKYPTYKRGRVTTRFFDLPEVRQPLMSLLSRRDFNLLTREYAVETPIKQIGDYLAVNVCRPHDCSDQTAGFAINLRTGFIYVRLQNEQEVRSFGSKGDYSDLPQDVQNYLSDFAAT